MVTSNVLSDSEQTMPAVTKPFIRNFERKKRETKLGLELRPAKSGGYRGRRIVRYEVK